MLPVISRTQGCPCKAAFLLDSPHFCSLTSSTTSTQHFLVGFIPNFCCRSKYLSFFHSGNSQWPEQRWPRVQGLLLVLSWAVWRTETPSLCTPLKVKCSSPKSLMAPETQNSQASFTYGGCKRNIFYMSINQLQILINPGNQEWSVSL